MRESVRADLGFNKRKHREDDGSTEMPSGEVPAFSSLHSNGKTTPSSIKGSESDNRILAGYLAHEFLTKGTLFGEQFEPVRVNPAPRLQSAGKQPVRRRSEGGGGRSIEMEAEIDKGSAKKMDSRSYAEVATLFQIPGTHIPGIVNPTQLARWIQM
ncbi:OLC1v1019640C1 [Oldenlandia corymbosa var. corymbosa]|uniref:OLC1v1019640C1 n=1 Tax=Oldenlandia corymbosa var. corymbosa TaxID=529605 RepID=A0AAV1EEE1_OLDCO|nr:OLC1v1019640C1 [Oldenlandia corymbosa var. corymbosa]